MRRCVHPPPVHPHSPATPGARAAFARPAPHHLCCTVPIARVSLQVKELPLWLTKELAPRNYIEYRTPHVFQPQQLSKLKAGPHQLRQPGLRVAHSARKYSHAAKVTLARVLVHPAVAPHTSRICRRVVTHATHRRCCCPARKAEPVLLRPCDRGMSPKPRHAFRTSPRPTHAELTVHRVRAAAVCKDGRGPGGAGAD